MPNALAAPVGGAWGGTVTTGPAASPLPAPLVAAGAAPAGCVVTTAPAGAQARDAADAAHRALLAHFSNAPLPALKTSAAAGSAPTPFGSAAPDGGPFAAAAGALQESAAPAGSLTPTALDRAPSAPLDPRPDAPPGAARAPPRPGGAGGGQGAQPGGERRALALATAGPQPPPKRPGRPVEYAGDPADPALTEEERRRLKRRVANRESARRVRARRSEMVGGLEARAAALAEQNARLLAAAGELEAARAAAAAAAAALRDAALGSALEAAALRGQVAALCDQMVRHGVPLPDMPAPAPAAGGDTAAVAALGGGAPQVQPQAQALPFQGQQLPPGAAALLGQLLGGGHR